MMLARPTSKPSGTASSGRMIARYCPYESLTKCASVMPAIRHVAGAASPLGADAGAAAGAAAAAPVGTNERDAMPRLRSARFVPVLHAARALENRAAHRRPTGCPA